jgi:hypothetical protein
MRPLVSALPFLLLAHAALGADELRATPAAWAPEGWRTITEADGDLDRDGDPDAVRVFEGQDAARVIPNDGLGASEINTNPRTLVVLLAEPGGYRRVGESKAFIPSAGSVESPCLEDPLSEVAIARGVLKVTLSYWASCGGWGSGRHVYGFRLEDGRMRLVGEDESTFMRNSGEKEEISTNHLTGKRKTTTGLDEFEPAESKPRIAWDRVDRAPRYLEQMTAD